MLKNVPFSNYGLSVEFKRLTHRWKMRSIHKSDAHSLGNMLFMLGNSVLHPLSRLAQIAVFISLTSTISGKSQAADFRFEADKLGQMLVFLEGPIVQGDAERFRTTLHQALGESFSDQAVVILDSPGGNVHEAKKIGQLVRYLLLTTRTAAAAFTKSPSATNYTGEVFGGMKTVTGQLHPESPERGVCASACTLVFASGVIRQPVDNHDERDYTIRVPSIEIHRPSLPDERVAELSAEEIEEAHYTMTRDMASFLKRMGASEAFIAKTMAISPKRTERVPANEVTLMIPEVVPFFQDWITAKCGFPEEHLKPSERELFARYPGSYSRDEWGYGGWWEKDITITGIDGLHDEATRETMLSIYEKVRVFQKAIRRCRVAAVKAHQYEWYRQQSK